MQVAELAVPGAWVFTPPVFPDDRGMFAAPFQSDAFVAAVGHPLTVAQANTSVSRRGVLRGVHFADVPPGQAKYVQCTAGALLDVVVDLRVGSPTFGRWDAVRLDGEALMAVYLSEGLGHAFLALEDHTVASYLCSTAYNPNAEHGVDPLDSELGLPWGDHMSADELVLSDKDRAAPSFGQALADGLLPDVADCQVRRAALSAPLMVPAPRYQTPTIVAGNIRQPAAL